jgi:hypothetical protein
VNRRESGGSGLPVTMEQLGIFGVSVSRETVDWDLRDLVLLGGVVGLR